VLISYRTDSTLKLEVGLVMFENLAYLYQQVYLFVEKSYHDDCRVSLQHVSYKIFTR